MLLQNNVLFSSVDANGNGLALQDKPLTNTTTGNLTVQGNLYVPGSVPTGPVTVLDPNNNINYRTGQFTITFPLAGMVPGPGAVINSQTVQSLLSLPQGICYYANQFILRPIPDQPYLINFEVYKNPTYLMETSSEPELNEYWQYIAYGAAIKILQDRVDMDTVNLLMPEFKVQESLCLRRTLVQYSNERTATIFSQQSEPGRGYGGFGSWGGPW
jgi:hypothetical protein